MANDPADVSHGLGDMLCFDVYAAHHAFTQAYKGLLEPLGLTYPQYLVLVALWSKDAQSVGALGAALGLESNTLTPLLKRMESAGLVVRRRDRRDERRVLVSLTERGRGLRAQASHIPGCIAAAAGLERGEFDRLHDLLVRLRGSLQGSRKAV